MLPSSAIAVTKRNFLFVLSTAVANSTAEAGVVVSSVDTTVAIVSLCLAFAVVYLVASFLKSRQYTFRSGEHSRLSLFTVFNQKINSKGAMRSSGLPIAAEVIHKFVVDFFRYITEEFCALSDLYKLHPALVLRLLSSKNIKLSGAYFIVGGYYEVINFIFTNIEIPLSSKLGGRSAFT
jgi:hypothetical protein